MKYYFPTTTLNFDGILSSQMIAPAGLHRPDTLWWNRFELVLGQRRDSLVLFNKIPIWTIDDPDRDNYPLVIEFDKSVLKAVRAEVREYALEDGLKALVARTPISFTALDLAQGCVRFIFQTEDEMDRMLLKVSTGVAECKVMESIRFDIPTAFSALPKSAKSATFPLSSTVGQLDEPLAHVQQAPEEGEVLDYPSETVRGERERGACLGYQVGRYAKALRSGYFVDAFRDPLSYSDWRSKVLPMPFVLVLDNLCSRPLTQPWDPNRSAIVAFCRDRWNDCFAGRKVAGKKIAEGSPLHASLQTIAQHWANPEQEYRISNLRDKHIQAFAAFLECGTQADRYPHYAKESILKSPEYLLALYGALVGYTQFSRILLDNKMYLPPPPPLRVVEPSCEHNHQKSGGGTHQRENDETCRKDDVTQGVKDQTEEVARQELRGLHGGVDEGQVNGVQPKAKKVAEQLPLFADGVGESAKELVKDKGLLVRDESLCVDAAREFSAMGESRIQELTQAIQVFCKGYTNGYYGENPGKYKQTNPDLIDHLLRCFRAKQTPKINFRWLNDDEEEKFVTYLEKRYTCRRKSHKRS